MKSPSIARDHEAGINVADDEKQSMQAAISQLEKDKQQLLVELRNLTEKLAKS